MMHIILKLLKNFIFILLLYLIYAFLSGAFYLKYDHPKDSNYQATHLVERFFRDDIGPDQVVLLEDGEFAYQVRIQLIEQAKQEIDIAYYMFQEDEYAEFLIAKLVEAAERGVKIRLIVDGVSNNHALMKQILVLFTLHSNIEIKYYEPFNLIKPWTLNNRLHDKIMLIDQAYTIIGGRNIGGRYFSDDQVFYNRTLDRDVLVYDTKEITGKSVIPEIVEYYNLLWNHPYTKYPLSTKNISKRQEKKANHFKDRMLHLLDDHELKVDVPIIFTENAFATNQIKLIHNPIERMIKEPWVWYDVKALMSNANESIYIQSPYIIPTDEMYHFLINNSADISTTILTNAISINPNFFGTIGYSNYRKALFQSSNTIYEYQGPESLHGKSLIIDGRISIIGSFNMDARSAHLSTETMLVIDSEEFAKYFEAETQTLFDNSLKLTSNGDYEINPEVNPTPIEKSKKVKIQFLAPFVHFFDFLL
jgi:cardiolipin synthase C